MPWPPASPWWTATGCTTPPLPPNWPGCWRAARRPRPCGTWPKPGWPWATARARWRRCSAGPAAEGPRPGPRRPAGPPGTRSWRPPSAPPRRRCPGCPRRPATTWPTAHPLGRPPSRGRGALSLRKARVALFPQDARALEDYVRALEKADRLSEADQSLAGGQALAPERRLLLRADLLTSHGDHRSAFRVLDGPVAEAWSMDFRAPMWPGWRRARWLLPPPGAPRSNPGSTPGRWCGSPPSSGPGSRGRAGRSASPDGSPLWQGPGPAGAAPDGAPPR